MSKPTRSDEYRRKLRRHNELKVRAVQGISDAEAAELERLAAWIDGVDEAAAAVEKVGK